MSSLIVIYPQPTDAEEFRTYYEHTHLPLAAALPGVRAIEYTLDLRTPDGSPGELFGLFRAEFDDPAAMAAALGSPQGAAVAADVANYATGGSTVLVGETRSKTSSHASAARDYLAAWNAHDVEAILATFAPGGRYTDPTTDGEIAGEPLREHLRGLFAAIPDLALDIETVHADGATAVAFWRGSGAGGALNFLGSDYLRFDENSKITWTAALYDQQQFSAQLAAATAA